ncbi:hypothetical protein LQK93_01948 [Terrabacter sp. BE26]
MRHGKRRWRPTFADLVREPTWSETDASSTGQHAPRPGGFNAAGEFFDLDGKSLHLVSEDVTEEEAQALLEAEAGVVIETCGCGGSYGGCTPQWVPDELLQGLKQSPGPRFTGRHGAPSWLEVWASDERKVVFAHGDVAWDDALTRSSVHGSRRPPC